MGDLFEQLAAIEHERWADWQRYLHSVCIKPEDLSPGVVLDRGCLVIPTALVERWERQIATPYADLTEQEKESDREQVRRYWTLLDAETSRAYETGVSDGQSAAVSAYKPLVRAAERYGKALAALRALPPSSSLEQTMTPLAMGALARAEVQREWVQARQALDQFVLTQQELAALAVNERAGE